LSLSPSEAKSSVALQSEPYVHSSGAFGFAVPEGWEVLNEDETSVHVTDMDSLVGALFADAGRSMKTRRC